LAKYWSPVGMTFVRRCVSIEDNALISVLTSVCTTWHQVRDVRQLAVGPAFIAHLFQWHLSNYVWFCKQGTGQHAAGQPIDILLIAAVGKAVGLW